MAPMTPDEVRARLAEAAEPSILDLPPTEAPKKPKKDGDGEERLNWCAEAVEVTWLVVSGRAGRVVTPLRSPPALPK